jgi:Yip1 domain
VSAEAQSSTSVERDWWLRLALVLQSPSSVFAWLRDDSPDAASARQEPITALTFAAGIGVFLSTRTAAHLFDTTEFDALLVVVEAVVAGLLVAIQNFWILGGAVCLGWRAADSTATYRQARHVVGLASAPFVLSLVAVWPVRLAMFGSDAFRSGGSDTGAAETVFRSIDGAFLAWAVLLLVIGVRTLHGWDWPRTLASLAVAGVVLAGIAFLFVGVPGG